MKPKIYTLQKPPVLGQLGEKTIINKVSLCDKCDLSKILYDKIEYVFDYWSGEDLVKGSIFYLASERLKEALLSNSITGCSYKKIISSTGHRFKVKKGAYSNRLPNFYQIIIEGKAKGPEIWWKRIKCSNCEKSKWIPTDIGIASMVGDNKENIKARQVFFSSYQEHDIFLLEDPGPPIITEKFMGVLDKLDVIGRKFPEAEWV